MFEIEALGVRVSRLERTNRLLRAAVGALIILVGAVIVLGSAPDVPATIEAQRFVLKDAAGHERGSLYATEKSWGLVLYNRDSSKGAAFTVSDNAAMAMLADHKGNVRDAMLVSDEESTMAIWDAKTNRVKIELRNSADGSSLSFKDDNGTNRLGVVFTGSAGGGMTINDANSTTRLVLSENAPGLTLFNADGGFSWMAGIDSLDKEEQKRVRAFIEETERRKKLEKALQK